MLANFRRPGVTALAVLMGAAFLYAGIIKVRAADAFADNIAGFRLLPPALNNLLAIGLPPFEILLGCLLIVGWQRRTAAFCALLLSGIFLLALLSAWLRGISVNCGCFGSEPGSLTPRQQLLLSIGRDLLLMGAAAAVYLDQWKQDRSRANETAVSPTNESLTKRR